MRTHLLSRKKYSAAYSATAGSNSTWTEVRRVRRPAVANSVGFKFSSHPYLGLMLALGGSYSESSGRAITVSRPHRRKYKPPS